MKKFLLTSLVSVLAVGAADACPTLGLARARTKTVTTTKVVPKTTVTEKTVLVPTKVQTVTTQPVVATKTRTAYRGAILPLALPCPNCKK